MKLWLIVAYLLFSSITGNSRIIWRPFSDCRYLVPFRRWYSRSKCEVARNCAKMHVFGPNFFGGEDPQILDQVFKIASISDHVAKFRGDRPRDRGDLALNKKEKKRKRKRKHKGGRCVIATGSPNTTIAGAAAHRAAQKKAPPTPGFGVLWRQPRGPRGRGRGLLTGKMDRKPSDFSGYLVIYRVTICFCNV